MSTFDFRAQQERTRRHTTMLVLLFVAVTAVIGAVIGVVTGLVLASELGKPDGFRVDLGVVAMAGGLVIALILAVALVRIATFGGDGARVALSLGAQEVTEDTKNPYVRRYFNERPIRGYFKKVSELNGKDNFAFVRVYDWINTMGENGGIVCSANHDYRKDSLVVDGIKYDMVTLIPHIDPRSFKRYGLMKPLKVIGGDNSGVNYEVKVIDGAFLGCNDFNDKFKLTARHEFRFKALYPEFSGFIAYRHSQRLGYALDVTARNYTAGPDTPADHEQFQTTGVDECMAAECAQCGEVSETTGEWVAPEDADASVLGLSPAGAVTTVSHGADYTVKLLVTRTGGAAACSVDYATANGTATAGSDYTAASGTLEWEAGDTAPKEIEVEVLAAATDTQTFTVTLSGAVGATLLLGAEDVTLTIDA